MFCPSEYSKDTHHDRDHPPNASVIYLSLPDLNDMGETGKDPKSEKSRPAGGTYLKEKTLVFDMSL
jgi:hypothetical protein